MLNYNCLTVDLHAINQNLKQLQAHLGRRTRLMVMVKGNGYGTDLVQLAQSLRNMNVSILGVAHVSEAVVLREQGITLPIFVINVFLEEFDEVIQHDLEIAVWDPAFCRQLNQAAMRRYKQVKVHLNINTGMNRFGCSPNRALELAVTCQNLPGLSLEGVMTHLVAPEIPTFDPFTHQQIEQFRTLVTQLHQADIHPTWIHLANTAAARRFSLPFCNIARIGIGLFQPENALTLESRIASIHTGQQGESVGYMRSYRIQKKRKRIAVIAIGYHDGLDLRYSGKGYVLIRGKRATYIGLICMDFMMVDITDIPEAQIGDPVLIFGKALPFQTIASWIKTNPRELLTALGPRIQRRFTPVSLDGIAVESEGFVSQKAP